MRLACKRTCRCQPCNAHSLSASPEEVVPSSYDLFAAPELFLMTAFEQAELGVAELGSVTGEHK